MKNSKKSPNKSKKVWTVKEYKQHLESVTGKTLIEKESPKKVWTVGDFKRYSKAILGDFLIENEPPKKIWTVGEFDRCLEAAIGEPLIKSKPPKDKSGYEPSGTLEVRFFPHIDKE